MSGMRRVLKRRKNETESGLYYSLGQAHEKFNQAVKITASAQNKHITVCESIFQLVFYVFNRKGIRKLMKLLLGKSTENVASHANLVFFFSLFPAKTHRPFNNFRSTQTSERCYSISPDYY